MSDNTLQKLREERDLLGKELDLLKKAIKPQEASEKIVAHIKKAEDPFCVPQDNEWATAGDTGKCCIVM